MKTIIFIFICCLGLNGMPFAQENNKGAKLVLSSQADTLTTNDAVFRFKISYINQSDRPVFFVPRSNFASLSNDYTALVITKDGNIKYFNPYKRICFRPTHRAGYQKINSQDSFTRCYEINFFQLTDSTGLAAAPSGSYSIVAWYIDNYKLRRHCIKQLTSNKLEVFYKKIP